MVRFVAWATAVVAVASLAFVMSARAEEPQFPPAQKKIENPLLTGAVGEWTVSWSGVGPTGPNSGTATSKLSLQVGGTVLVEDYASPEMMPGVGFFGHGVTKVSDDGKTVTTWWFDNMSGEPVKLTGPLTDTTSTVEGDLPGMGKTKIVWKKVDGGFDFEGTLEGNPWLKQQYRKK